MIVFCFIFLLHLHQSHACNHPIVGSEEPIRRHFGITSAIAPSTSSFTDPHNYPLWWATCNSSTTALYLFGYIEPFVNIVINSNAALLRCFDSDNLPCIVLGTDQNLSSSTAYGEACFEIENLACFAPYRNLFDLAYLPMSDAFDDCEQYPYRISFATHPAYVAFADCTDKTVWIDALQSCQPIANTGCPRTPLSCQSDCTKPSTNPIPTLDDNHSQDIQLYETVKWNGCESIYISCPSGYVLAMYNSFTEYVRFTDKSSLTVYCGNNQDYYAFYKKDNGKICSSTFDVINCIKSTNHPPSEHLSFCVDDLIERKLTKMQIMSVGKTKRIYISMIVFVILLFILITIAHFHRRSLHRIAIRFLPESEISQFINQYEQWRISRRPLIEYKHRIGNWRWELVEYLFW